MEQDAAYPHLRMLGPEESLEAAATGAPLALLLFGTATCTPCQALKMKVSRWLESRDGRADVLSIDAIYVSLDEHPALAAQANVLAAPTIRLYALGQLWAEAGGYFSLEAFLERTELVEERLRMSR